MMDDFERELTNGLRRQAGQAPRFEGQLDTVYRRGRNRRWMTRGASAVGALALFGGGFALWSNMDQGAAVDEVATEFTPSVAVDPTPTPTPTPTPEPEEPFTIPTPPVDAAEPDDPDAANLVVATGWGVGLVKPTGDLYAPIVCCADDELRWWAQKRAPAPTEDGWVDQGAVTARDDHRGGIVSASANALFWTPSLTDPGASDGSASIVLDAMPQAKKRASDDVRSAAPDAPLERGGSWLQLWDVEIFDDQTHVLYSTTEISDDDEAGGTVRLLAATLEDDSVVAAAEELEVFTWAGPDDDWFVITGASWIPGRGWMAMKSHGGGACSWIEFQGAPGTATDVASPFPRPDDLRDCPHRSLATAAVDDAGEVIAVSENYVEGREELALYRLSDTATVNRVSLPQTAEDTGRWSEMDFAAEGVLISRGAGMAPEAWPTDDETLLLRVDDEVVTPIGYVGSVSWPRAAVSTEGLEGLDPRGPRWFGARVGADDPVERGDADEQATAPTQATPDPADEIGDENDSASEDSDDDGPKRKRRRAVKPGDNVIAPDAMVGADGCVGGGQPWVCVGWDFDDAAASLDGLFGSSEQTDDPATFIDGQPHPPNVHVWLDTSRRVTLEVIDGMVVGVAATPEGPDGLTTPFDPPLTVRDLLEALGAPIEIVQERSGGASRFALTYEAQGGAVRYSYVELTDAASSLTGEDGTLEAVPEAYDALPVVAYRAQAAA